MRNRLHFEIDLPHLALLLVLFFTLVHGFFNSLSFEYTPSYEPTATFLATPRDLHADLIKSALSLPPYVTPQMSGWSPLYREYYLKNPYQNPDLVAGQPVKRLTSLHFPPICLLLSMLVKRFILASNPQTVIFLNNGISLFFLGVVCCCVMQKWRDRLLAFTVMALSYPFLMILSRGNQGALFTGLPLLLFIYYACITRNLIAAALCLAVACNFRPNAVLLAPLLFSFGFRRCVLGGAIFAVVSAALFFISYEIDRILYPGYTLSVFSQALNTYYEAYAFGGLGDQFNNSAFGAFKFLWDMITTVDYSQAYVMTIHQANLIIFMTFTIVLAGGLLLFRKQKLTKMEFAYVSVACYVLISTILASYHLLVFFTFLILLCREVSERELGRVDGVILFCSVFVLVPKNYFFNHFISYEVLLNPLVLTASLFYIFSVAWHRKAEANGEDEAPISVPARTS